MESIKKSISTTKKNRTESIEKFLLEFNAKKSNLKYITWGGLVAFLIPFTYYQFLADSKKTIATQQKTKEKISSFTAPAKPNVQANKLDATPNKNNGLATLPKQELKNETDSSNNESTSSTSSTKKILATEQGKIKVWTDKKNYKIGGTLTISFDADRTLYVQIFIVNSVGEVTALFPNPCQLNNLLKPNQIYQIPPKNAEFSLDISGPKGKDKIFALASSKPFPTKTLAIDKSGEPIKTELTESYIQFQTTYRIY